ncbi:hypothetical protein Ab1vBOLIVR5_gp93c [Agrobacterium phage OLIVR5]|uniref:Uncharacterized protein n=1 Tax=Agrobacterium phage OLIVR5 TaxID=2723773 RepID=A0A858MTK6_9CAUD|nr:hypothetical protein KNU99_gp093 [Agrobacterium phage OLIVR5]QIW87741.1 hypothetical protein Ab1vBOLIVR5_gp93c [Agrobacterium phage OLIVR5]QIW88003.1 hypothetical protein Ab1vBOLIVR6_gp96c [Agrobacterium phage OLIVR6]
MDRTGKSTLAKPEMLRQFPSVRGYYFHETRYSNQAKELFQDPVTSVSVSKALAISELLEVVAYMEDYGNNKVIMPRSFLSSMIYMDMRGNFPEALSLQVQCDYILDKYNIVHVPVFLSVSKIGMMYRGAKENSFEVKNYDAVKASIDKVAPKNSLTYDSGAWMMEDLRDELVRTIYRYDRKDQ